MQLFSLIICFAKFTNPIRDVTDIRRISATRIAGSGGWLLCTSVRTSIYLKFSFFFRLIFTMLEKEITPVIRANLIIALGDLSFRLVNLNILRSFVKSLMSSFKHTCSASHCFVPSNKTIHSLYDKHARENIFFLHIYTCKSKVLIFIV